MPSLKRLLPGALLFPLAACAAPGPPRSENAPARQASAQEPPLGLVPLARDYTWKTEAMGLYETGLLLADIDGDGHADLVTASGNDTGLQPLAMYRNDGKGHFPARPSFLSEDLDANMNLAVGDIDLDGFLDVAVSTLGPPYGTGGVKIYFNRQGTLEKKPSFRSRDVYSSFACALGDVDGDGDLDLAVSVMAEPGSPEGGSARVYFNERGVIADTPGWKARERIFGAGILFADAEQDGYLDLVVGGSRVFVYRGGPSESGSAALSPEPWWVSGEGPLVPYLAAGPLGRAGRIALVASRNDLLCLFAGKPCPAPRYEVYQPALGGYAPTWRSSSSGLGSGIRLADIDGDGVTDLLGGSWGETRPDGGRLEIYRGEKDAFTREPVFRATRAHASLIQSIDAADLRGGATCPRLHRALLPRRAAVLTLPEALIGGVTGIRKNGVALDGRRDYTTIPAAPWISFAKPLEAGDRLEIDYTRPSFVDVVVANQDCGIGVYRYDHHATAPRCATQEMDR
ncbi:VCBS repeat-containing protein [Polyangium sp. 15x6]|uniref:FG-GAP repeat domain-containing protein n=1 Tax=Polyangium sp. 15x6 TaxID=3042687 RepID=UPI00249CCB26|nr:VCBS repeat-containing protein [Polyangium sp. 15x6]MDI3286591.1 VCBS repeat-containing protein [Polyangium sp. 15x6]